MAGTRIDHLVILAPTLDAGRRTIETSFGVPLQDGGRHAAMGTHNALLRLGPALYLEVIAVDPEAAAPTRPRWFGLDTPPARTHLATWVARSGALDIVLDWAPEPLGNTVTLTRGDYRWRITIAADGTLPLGGVAPALIEWQVPMHPAAHMPDVGCTLVGLELRHPDTARVKRLMESLGVLEPDISLDVIEAPEPRLVAHIRTPLGLRTL